MKKTLGVVLAGRAARVSCGLILPSRWQSSRRAAPMRPTNPRPAGREQTTLAPFVPALPEPVATGEALAPAAAKTAAQPVALEHWGEAEALAAVERRPAEPEPLEAEPQGLAGPPERTERAERGLGEPLAAGGAERTERAERGLGEPPAVGGAERTERAAAAERTERAAAAEDRSIVRELRRARAPSTGFRIPCPESFEWTRI